MALATILLIAAATATATPAPTPAPVIGTAIERAAELAEQHRYAEVIALLAPLADAGIDDPEARYATAAETGRAHFHLGDYRLADAELRQAVMLRPERVETALYLEATSWILGNRPQALQILDAILTGGAKDLYAAVTLPGARSFLADPEVWKLIQSHSIELSIAAEGCTILDLPERPSQSVIEARFGASSSGDGAVSTARAGPAPIWAMAFDDGHRLSELVLEIHNLVRYTPYRPVLHTSNDRVVPWNATAATAFVALGPPARSAEDDDGSVVTAWTTASGTLEIVFAPPTDPIPAGMDRQAAVPRRVRLLCAAGNETEEQ
jgi:hypothetical protein